MNYLKEINAFHIKKETEPLTMAAAQLWFTLMDINNRAGWKEQFTVPVSLLCAKAGMKEGNFKRARTELREKGYIRVVYEGVDWEGKLQMIVLMDYYGCVHFS